MKMLQPDPIPRALMRRAHARGMPVYAVSPGSRTWLYGQGRAGWNFFEVANHRDSYTGSRLARDKFISNQLVSRLGLPGVKHGIASTVEAAVRIAAHLGFPVVVKPVDLSKGRGVSVNVTSVEELRAAFAKASPLSRQGVIVERHVPGDDYRLVAIGGRFQWAIRRLPPRIVGNGENTVAELIDQENGRRSDADVAAGFIYRIRIDEDVHKVLAKQGLGIEDRPAGGAVIDLRSNANTATGGTLSDCTADVHPDNREMVEAIARNFHLDAIGIDFITTDISKSWRDLDCGVIEVNSTPGISSDDRAEIVLADKFPDGADGRLPSVVVIGDDCLLLAGVSAALGKHAGHVGQTDGTETRIAGYLRCREGDTLADRVRALLLDAACEALVIGTTPQEIERHGFPLDRCDLALVGAGAELPRAMRELIGACAGTVISDVSAETFDRDAEPAVEGIAGR
jgi:cyanophycin synthetase